MVEPLAIITHFLVVVVGYLLFVVTKHFQHLTHFLDNLLRISALIWSWTFHVCLADLGISINLLRVIVVHIYVNLANGVFHTESISKVVEKGFHHFIISSISFIFLFVAKNLLTISSIFLRSLIFAILGA